jgi:hypothetical protein
MRSSTLSVVKAKETMLPSTLRSGHFYLDEKRTFQSRCNTWCRLYIHMSYFSRIKMSYSRCSGEDRRDARTDLYEPPRTNSARDSNRRLKPERAEELSQLAAKLLPDWPPNPGRFHRFSSFDVFGRKIENFTDIMVAVR